MGAQVLGKVERGLGTSNFVLFLRGSLIKK